MKPLSITGFGVVSPYGVGWDDFRDGVSDASRDVFDVSTSLFDASPYGGAPLAEARGFDATKHLGATGLRNNDRLTKLLLVAARTALAHAGLKVGGAWQRLSPDEVGVVGATSYGSLEAIHELNTVARTEDPRYLNPARFPNTVINSSVGYVSIWDELRALNATVVNGPPGALDAVSSASLYLAAHRAKAVLVGGGECLSEPLVLGLHHAGALDRGSPAWAPGRKKSTGLRVGEGAAFAVLEAPRGAAVTEYGRVIGYGTAFDPREGEDSFCGPSADAMERAIRAALRDASVAPAEVDVVATGLSGYGAMDVPELAALRAVFGGAQCLAAPKGRYGETLGASGALGLAAAAAWLGGERVTGIVEGAPPAQVRTCVVTALGFHGNASALFVRGPDQRNS